ncbi:hypothetical protein FGO68_gene180 [Halteria grandinella]|uniref:Uncharacterized protein n=1 Tax=Halteria grandinella TaxID=5974 RepID=A0A8J8P783_HALGN|nr:hypothetical protein FGO68_gene180 [Halteria grandinella]
MATYYNASPPPKQPIERQIQEMQQKGVYPRQLDMIGILRPNAVIKKNPAAGAQAIKERDVQCIWDPAVGASAESGRTKGKQSAATKAHKGQ